MGAATNPIVFRFPLLQLVAVAVLLSGCGGDVSEPGAALSPHVRTAAGHAVGLGAVLTAHGGQIFGFDLNQHGSDGVLATASDVETFDQSTGAITKVFPKNNPPRTSYVAMGIVANDVGLINRQVEPKGSIYAKRLYDVMQPVTANKFTGKWTPPVKDFQVESAGPNQSTAQTAMFGIELKNQDIPDVFSSNVAKNTFGKLIHLDPDKFGVGNQPQAAQDTATNEEVIATSPDGGRVGGAPPINVLVNLKTGKQVQFNGFNNGYFHAGDVNGLAVDSASGIAATTTELNAQVEFYNLAKQNGVFAQLPCTGDTSQGNSGAGIANDSVNGLFLVTDPTYCAGSQGSAIVVYDESGNLIETITGFKFAIGEPAPVINPATRTGWAFGPTFGQLQQFFY
ncbi:MAG TPA: hypothetical protein VHX17_08335 [Candidatus Cybelea sp.]|jgi:hypothetical protein|nr:hypothetical protein [Candidatus Cybelea sp.]